jgi:hypothetical protein
MDAEPLNETSLTDILTHHNWEKSALTALSNYPYRLALAIPFSQKHTHLGTQRMMAMFFVG